MKPLAKIRSRVEQLLKTWSHLGEERAILKQVIYDKNDYSTVKVE